MKLTKKNLIECHNLAVKAATEAAELINSRKKDFTVRKKKGGDSFASQLVTEVDHLSQELILSTLEETLQAVSFGLLTEEREDDKSRFANDYFWSIDPLDGTLPFTEGRDGYAVSIALVDRSGMPWIGVVVDPFHDNLYTAINGIGAWKNNESFTVSGENNHLLITADRSYARSNDYQQVLTHLRENGKVKIHIKSHGGAVMNALWVLENGAGAYIKFPKLQRGGGSLWDYAASACIYEQLGAWVSDIYGNPLELNRADDTFMNHRGVIYASNADLARIIIDFFASGHK